MEPRAYSLDEERKLPAHLAVHDIGESEADRGHGQHCEIMAEWRNLTEQRIADDLDEIEQEAVVDDEAATAGELAIVPAYGCDEKSEMHDVANEQLHVTEARADEAHHHHDPGPVDEQQDDAGNREQARPSEGNQEKHDAHKV